MCRGTAKRTEVREFANFYVEVPLSDSCKQDRPRSCISQDIQVIWFIWKPSLEPEFGSLGEVQMKLVTIRAQRVDFTCHF